VKHVERLSECGLYLCLFRLHDVLVSFSPFPLFFSCSLFFALLCSSLLLFFLSLLGKLHFVNPLHHDYFDVSFQQDLNPALQSHSEDVELTMEPKAGRVVIFSSGTENTHFLEQVTKGKRYVLSFWFTCDERKQFNIFLDGNAHITFSHQFREQMIKSKADFYKKHGSRESSKEKKRRNGDL
jgi:hypothetical protein